MSTHFSTLILALFIDLIQGTGFQHVTCGSVLKLAHSQTNARLHSHEVRYGSGSGQQSVTGVTDTGDANSYWVVKGTEEKPCKRGQNQEVSAFGENGVGDTGDYWIVQCDDDDYWRRDDPIHFKHKDTGMYLVATHNQFGRPISGQREICALSSQGSESLWQAMEGIYLKPSDGS